MKCIDIDKKYNNFIENIEVNITEAKQTILNTKQNEKLILEKKKLLTQFPNTKDVLEGTPQEQFNAVYDQLTYYDSVRYNMGVSGGSRKNKSNKRKSNKRKSNNN